MNLLKAVVDAVLLLFVINATLDGLGRSPLSSFWVAQALVLVPLLWIGLNTAEANDLKRKELADRARVPDIV